MAVRAWESGLVLLLVFGRLTWAEPVRVPVAPLCAAKSVGESVLLGLGETSRCPKNGYESVQSVDSICVTEVLQIWYFFFGLLVWSLSVGFCFVILNGY